MPKKSWNDSDLTSALKKSTSLRQILVHLKLKPTGGNYKQIQKRLEILQVDRINLRGKGWNITGRGLKREKTPLSEILKENSIYQSYKLKQRLYKENIKIAKCEECGWAKRAENGRIPVE